MNRLKILFVPLVMVLSACEARNESRYESRFEAQQSCEDWISKGGTWYHKNHGGTSVRYCVEDRETKQILGFDAPEMAGNRYDSDYGYSLQRKTRPPAKRFKW